jgi:hypothetical protein
MVAATVRTTPTFKINGAVSISGLAIFHPQFYLE